AGKLAKITSAGVVGDSLVSEGSTVVTFNSALALPTITPAGANVTINGAVFLSAHRGAFLGLNSNLSFTNTVTGTGIGTIALRKLTTGGSNTTIGYGTGANLETGARNTILGDSAGVNLTAAIDNVIAGAESASARQSGDA